MLISLLVAVAVGITKPAAAAMINFSYFGQNAGAPEYFLSGVVSYSDAITPIAKTVGGHQFYQYPVATLDLTMTGEGQYWGGSRSYTGGPWSLILDAPGGSLMGIEYWDETNSTHWMELVGPTYIAAWSVTAMSGGYSPHIRLDITWSYTENLPILTLVGSSPATVPVPAAAWLFGSGILGLIGLARRKKA